MSTPPVLDAYRHPDGIHFVVFCPDCRYWHWHSAENGRRAAHCSRVYLSMRGPKLVCEPNNGTLYKTGYILRERDCSLERSCGSRRFGTVLPDQNRDCKGIRH